MRIFLRIVVIVLAILVLIQFVPVTRSNPPVETEIAAPENVQAILSRSCYDCHSNKTVWPWYSYVAPVSWLVASDVSGGRQKMNFTTWNRYTPDEQVKKVRAIWNQVDRGNMPPWYYLIEHNNARLSADDKAILRDWSQAAH
ncbi:MAG TPA: heme-binding domain-containing protein [Blastocatellia bacterium]|nr:heme-binding domain-containing protein [Blastocatellia bacterium]